jgi:hypothetical protein
MAGYHRGFVKYFSIIAKPLSMLTHKNVRFEWTSECERSFQVLKEKLVTAPILTLPKPSKHFYLTSRTGVSPYARWEGDCLCIKAVENA